MTITQKDLLLVIDMQNVYLPEGAWSCPNITSCIPYIENMIQQFPKNQVVFTRFIASANPKGIWRDYNSVNANINQDSWSNEYISQLQPYLTQDNLYTKSTYSCSSNQDLLAHIHSFENIYITGVVAECCVLSTVFELIDMGKKVYYLAQGIAGETTEKEKAIINLLEGLSPLHVEFVF